MSLQEPIVKRNRATGHIYLREVVVLSFYMWPPIGDVADAMIAAFDRFTRMLPAGVMKWEAIGASSEEWKPVNATTFQRCRAQLSGQMVKRRRLTAFHLVDGEVGADAPVYSCKVLGPGKSDHSDELCLFEMSFPTAAVLPGSVDAFVANVSEIAAAIPYVSGYASPALQWAELGREEAFAASRAVVARCPGYDINMNSTGRIWLGARVRGARWVSFLGPDLLRQLGGPQTLRTVLPPEVALQQVGSGAMLRAGTMPEIGDDGDSATTPLLRAVALALEPVTAFREVVLLGSFADWNEERLEKWERRFFR